MPVPVRIKDVVEALDESADFAMHFLDKRTGEIILITDEEWEAAETDKLLSEYPEWQRETILKAREIQQSEHFIELPGKAEIDEHGIREAFARDYKDQRTSAELLRSITGKGAFRRFKDTISHLDLWREWNEFRGNELEAIAVEWLESDEISYTREDIAELNSDTAM